MVYRPGLNSINTIINAKTPSAVTGSKVLH
jgi:hypothetical protein